MEDRWHGDGGGRMAVKWGGGRGEGGSGWWLHGSAQSEWCLVLMRSLFIKSTQGGCASA